MNIFKYLKKKKVCAVVRVNEPDECLKIVEALYLGGIRIVEIVLDPDLQTEVIKKLKEHPEIGDDLAIIAGGIITAREALSLIDNGIYAISSPVLQIGLIKLCNSKSIYMWCTVSTANEAYEAWKYRQPMIKLHPTDALGGAIYIKEILKTMPFLNLIAAGGIKVDEIDDYIKAGAIGVCIGRDLYQSFDPETIKKQAQKAIEIAERL